MHLRTRPKPFYCGLGGQRKTGWHLKPLNVPSGKNFSWQEQLSNLGFRSGAHCHYSFPDSRTSTSISWRLQKDHKKTRTVSLNTQAGSLPLLVTQSQRTVHDHLELHFQVWGKDTSVQQHCSSVVKNLITHVNQSRVVSVFWWLLFSFRTHEIKTPQAENIFQYDTVWFTLPETHLPIKEITRLVQNIFHIREAACTARRNGYQSRTRIMSFSTWDAIWARISLRWHLQPSKTQYQN